MDNHHTDKKIGIMEGWVKKKKTIFHHSIGMALILCRQIQKLHYGF